MANMAAKSCLLCLGYLLFLPVRPVYSQTAIQAQEERVQFIILADRLPLQPEGGFNSLPDALKLAAYRVASGFLAGIPFRFEANRDRVTIVEQVEEVPEKLELSAVSNIDSFVRLEFSFSLQPEVASEARSCPRFTGHGISTEELMPLARQEALRQALEEAVRSALSTTYVRSGKPLPGAVEGRIRWYEITNEGIDRESGLYVVDLNAWIDIQGDNTGEAEQN